MSISQYVFIAILVCSFILVAGCTQSDGKTVKPAPASASLTLKSFVLTYLDVPPDFTLSESRKKNSTEVGNPAR